MSVDSLAELQQFVSTCTSMAWDSAEDAELIKFSEATVNERRHKSFNLSHTLIQHPNYADRPLYYCEKAWGAVLSIDLRGSTTRAMRVDARNTFVSMHVYMQTMLRLVSKAEGTIIGLRGDGLLAVFGHRKVKADLTDDDPEASHDALVTAVECGDAMLRAVEKVVNPALAKRGIKDALLAGVGVDCGKMMITKIGLRTAYDVTAYGTCVNLAAKASSLKENRNEVLMAKTAEKAFRRSDTGTIKIRPFNADYFRVVYPTPTLV